MVKEKKKRSDLEVPEFVRTEWNKGTAAKNRLASALQEANWEKAGHVISLLA